MTNFLWVEVQRQMFRESRLSPEQIKYLAALGLTWVLAEEIVNMSAACWTSQFSLLKTHAQDLETVDFVTLKNVLDENLFQFFVRQIGLRRLNFLQLNRVRKLNDLGVDWEFCRDENDDQWDDFISSLMEYKRAYGVCEVDQQFDKQLYQLLNQYRYSASQGKLSSTQILQLKALGIFNIK
eukprot:TRINITY_DN19484_c0_g1_i2.p3 TRINITY_DN19484_c0_g1~~TRINITY_DN19484_c0_g1_i2.p3  ORF type:complete len:181 (-),score=18.37 TRINITY_DN19484_c0_g1_i2:639-1181(-)